jgi:hypothetical protein
MLEDGTGLTSVDERSRATMSRKSLELKQGSREIKGDFDGANGVPAFYPTMRLHD